MKNRILVIGIFFLLTVSVFTPMVLGSCLRISYNQFDDKNCISKNSFFINNGPIPPSQPNEGPGGSSYLHNAVQESSYKKDAEQYWIFEPITPKPESAPLIVFNHGWSAINPITYIEWIEHIVRKGNIVVYPRYQKGLYFGFKEFSENAIQAVKDAIDVLQQNGHVSPELDKFAIVGHSLGGGITANMAAQAEDDGLPIPKAIMPVQPAIAYSKIADFSKIHPDTLMLVVVGEDDDVVGNRSGIIIFNESVQIPLSNKDFIIQITDTYGNPDLVADHLAPLCFPSPEYDTVDAMDFYSTWKLFDALTDFAFYGINEEYCLGNTSEQRYMGEWSDKTPVKELVVTDYPVEGSVKVKVHQYENIGQRILHYNLINQLIKRDMIRSFFIRLVEKIQMSIQ